MSMTTSVSATKKVTTASWKWKIESEVVRRRQPATGGVEVKGGTEEESDEDGVVRKKSGLLLQNRKVRLMMRYLGCVI